MKAPKNVKRFRGLAAMPRLPEVERQAGQEELDALIARMSVSEQLQCRGMSRAEADNMQAGIEAPPGKMG